MTDDVMSVDVSALEHDGVYLGKYADNLGELLAYLKDNLARHEAGAVGANDQISQSIKQFMDPIQGNGLTVMEQIKLLLTSHGEDVTALNKLMSDTNTGATDAVKGGGKKA